MVVEFHLADFLIGYLVGVIIAAIWVWLQDR